MAANAVLALMPMLDYQQSRAQVFPSEESLRWFVRARRSELLDAGALLMVAGRKVISPEEFDAVVLDVGRRTAARSQR